MTDSRTALQERLRSLFVGELEEAVRALDEGLLRLESASAGVDGGRELIRELFRVAHGLKGAAHSADVAAAVAAATRLEEALAELRDREGPVAADEVTALLADVGTLARIHAELTGTPAPPPTNGSAAVAADRGRTRVSTGVLDVLAGRSAELVAMARRVERLAGSLTSLDGDDPRAVDRIAGEATVVARDFGRLTAQLVGATNELTLVPFGDACDGLGRAVHDLAVHAGKQAHLVIVGAEEEIERTLVAALREPLLHVVRNAVDHGIEAPNQRAAAGKPDVGTVRVSARLGEGKLEVVVEDDGGGVDLDAVRIAAERLGVEGEAADLVFEPGVTTAATVTEVSGRGVGLDAVRDRIEAIGGSVSLDTRPGLGVRVRIVTPVSLALLRVVAVDVGGDVLCLPSAAVDRLLRVPADAVMELDGRAVLTEDDHVVPVLPLGAVVGFGGEVAPGPLSLAVVQAADRSAALAVDAFLDELELVVKPPPTRVAGLGELLGAGVLPDGRPTIVLNPAACVRRAANGRASALVQREAAPTTAPRPQLLLVEDTMTTRLLERTILESAGYEVLDAADGAEGWRLLQRHGADLVVSDIHMPAMDGIELCRAIRASDRFADLPVVLVTSLASDEDRRRGVEAGASAYVAKSEATQDTLLDAIRRLL